MQPLICVYIRQHLMHTRNPGLTHPARMAYMIAMKLGTYLKLKSMTTDEFGRRIGVSGATIRRWRMGTQFPRPDVIVRIQRETDGAVTANDFVPQDDEGRPHQAA